MRTILRRMLGTAVIVGSLAPCAALAQEGEPAPEPPAEVDPSADADLGLTAPDATEERLRRLEERDREQQDELTRALGRVDELEQALAAREEAVVEEPAPAAPSGPVVRPLASLFTRFEHRGGYAALGAANPGCFPGANDGDCVRYRASAGVAIEDLRVSEDLVLAVRFLPQVTGFWAFAPARSGGITHPTIDLYEGNLILRIGGAVQVDVGRIVLNYGDQMVIGALRWHPAGRSFDGARMRIQPGGEGAWVDLFWTMLEEGGPGGHGYGDSSFYGAYAGLGPLLGAGAHLDAYALGRQRNDVMDPETGAQVDWSLLVHVGARLRYRIEIVDLRFEGGIQLGRQGRPTGTEAATILAGHIDGEVGLNLADDRVRIGAHGFFASGDDPSTAELEAYDQLFPTAHVFLGLSDVMGARTNVVGGALHLLGKPIPELHLGLDLFVFARPQPGAVDGFAGAEGDVNVIWLPGAGLRVRGMYGLFVPNEGFWTTSSDPVHFVEVELGYELN